MKLAIYVAVVLSLTTTIFEIMKLFQGYGKKIISVLIISIYLAGSVLGLIYGILVDAIPIMVVDSFAFLVGIVQLVGKIKGQGG